MKIVILDGYTANPGDLSWNAFEQLGDLTVYDRTPRDSIVKHIGQAEIILTNKTPITSETLNSCPQIKYIGVLATGYNVVDYAAAKEKGILVTNIPAYSTASVAQFVFALLLEHCLHVGHHTEEVKKGRWSSNIDWCFWDYPLMELAGKTMGIIGFGSIGQAVAKIALAFGMKVVAYNRSQNDAGRALATYVSLEELYECSDVISLHIPLFPETEGMICKKSIAQMKKGTVLINTARGPLVCESDVRDALVSGHLAAYAADVVSVEPIKPDNPLLGAPNCFLTAHIAWASKESRTRLLTAAAENVRSFLAGKPINVINL